MIDAYAAGLFDGEGTVRVAKWAKPNSIHTRWQVLAFIGVTHYPVVEELRDAYGGSINQNRHDLRNPDHRIQFTWRVASQAAQVFLGKIVPYLIIKREEVELALLLQADIDKYRFKLGNRFWLHADRDEILARRAAMADQIRALKHRAYPPIASPGRIGRPKGVKRGSHVILLNGGP